MHTSHFQQTPDTVDDEGGTAHFTDDHAPPVTAAVVEAELSFVDKPVNDTLSSSTRAESSSASPNTQRTYQSTKASRVSTPPAAVEDDDFTMERSALP